MIASFKGARNVQNSYCVEQKNMHKNCACIVKAMSCLCKYMLSLYKSCVCLNEMVICKYKERFLRRSMTKTKIEKEYHMIFYVCS